MKNKEGNSFIQRLISIAHTVWLTLVAFSPFNNNLNGGNLSITLGDVYERYCALHLPTVTESTRSKFTARCEKFIRPYLRTKIAQFTPELVAHYLRQSKASYVPGPYSKRYNFHKELKDLKCIFQWWSDQYDFKFKNPVRPFHKAIAVIAETPERDRKISMEETLKFFSTLESKKLYQDLAITQFYCGGRIGEIAGIQRKNIDLEKRTLKIKEVIVWINGTPQIKPCPKNGLARLVYLNDSLLAILTRRINESPSDCAFIFHDRGLPLRYNRINVAFNSAWKKAGLSGKFSGSHLLRYSSAQAVRQITGSLDATASVTGHQSMKMAEHYGKLDSVGINQKSVIQMESRMQELNLKRQETAGPGLVTRKKIAA